MNGDEREVVGRFCATTGRVADICAVDRNLKQQSLRIRKGTWHMRMLQNDDDAGRLGERTGGQEQQCPARSHYRVGVVLWAVRAL